jgi:CheY-like chemotaxis protein
VTAGVSMNMDTESTRVLVVDDDPELRETFIEVLEDNGFVTAGASNGLEALQRLRTDALPGLILLDMMMPRMDGRTFRERQLEDNRLREIPVVVVSAARDVGEEARGLRAAAVLKKPLDIHELLTAVKTHARPEALSAPRGDAQGSSSP